MDDAAINNLQSGCGTQSDLKQKPKEASMQLDRVCEFGNRVVFSYAVVHVVDRVQNEYLCLEFSCESHAMMFKLRWLS
jgi:hypothetical protein